MGRKRSGQDNGNHPRPFDKARDELFSHILNCGVIDADEQHQRDWFDDTLDYLAQRYPSLTKDMLTALRTLGERYCRPVRSDDRTVNTPG